MGIVEFPYDDSIKFKPLSLRERLRDSWNWGNLQPAILGGSWAAYFGLLLLGVLGVIE